VHQGRFAGNPSQVNPGGRPGALPGLLLAVAMPAAFRAAPTRQEACDCLNSRGRVNQLCYLSAKSEAPLTHMHPSGTLRHMRTTLIIDEELLERARELTGIREKTALVRAGLEALIAREAGKRLAELDGTQRRVASIPRRRPA